MWAVACLRGQDTVWVMARGLIALYKGKKLIKWWILQRFNCPSKTLKFLRTKASLFGFDFVHVKHFRPITQLIPHLIWILVSQVEPDLQSVCSITACRGQASIWFVVVIFGLCWPTKAEGSAEETWALWVRWVTQGHQQMSFPLYLEGLWWV